MFIPLEHRPEINDLLSLIIKENSANTPLAKCMKKLYFQQLIITLLRCNATEHVITKADIKLADFSIDKAMKYINSNYQTSITLDSLAKMLNLNPSYFSLKFKNVNGIGFKEYLINVRINHSEKLLLETKKSITDIALECGFDSSNYFGDAFRKKRGISPSEFRKLKGDIK